MARDLTDVIVALSRIQSDLRAVSGSLYAYPDDPIAEETIVTLVQTLQARVHLWMRQDAHERRVLPRRHAERRTYERRQVDDGEESTAAADPLTPSGADTV